MLYDELSIVAALKYCHTQLFFVAVSDVSGVKASISESESDFSAILEVACGKLR